MDIQKILSFETMITPRIIQGVYLIGAILITLFGVASIGRSFVFGLLVIILGNIGWRINCELVILLFKIKDELSKSRKELEDSTSF